MTRTTPYPSSGTHLYHIAMREPSQVPLDEVILPAPPQAPTAPSGVSLLTLILPPAIMIAGSVISALVMGTNSLVLILPMAMMGLGYPLASVITNKSARKKYAAAVEQRKSTYVAALREQRSRIEGLIEQQRSVLNEEHPSAEATLAIGMAAGDNRRLWWRRPQDPDFLTLRLGQEAGPLSFRLNPPNIFTPEDPLSGMPAELIQYYDRVEGLPFLVDLKRAGSLALYGSSFRQVLRLARRLLTDLLVHHSPEDAHLFVLADRVNAGEQWEWLKWAPHTHALQSSYEGHNLLFTTDGINAFLDQLKTVHLERLEQCKSYQSSEAGTPGPALVVMFDDNGVVRQHDDVRRLAAEGYQTGIYLLFLGDNALPATCRARVEIDSAEQVHYLESIEAHGSGNHRSGQAELLRENDVEPLARTLAGLQVAGSKSSQSLPSIVRVIDLLPENPFSTEDIRDRWKTPCEDSRQVLLPVGQYVDRSGLATYAIDFRPEAIGGKGAYHAMMIGTTGSGKSIFMQSMVLAAAHTYSPRQLNFMFMDFKAGAAELKKVSDLPHSVGMVTDLSRELADRALQALENELARRKIIFDSAGKITDIWDFNRRFPSERMPHLLVVIDEFAEGINILPNLVERLKELGRQGRAFGMYFFLANQEVNSAVDQLKANVGWYVLLKVNRQEEMSLIGRNLPVPPGRGRGYVKVKSEITTVQSAYAGLPAHEDDHDDVDIDEYVISTFSPDGRRRELYRFDPRSQLTGESGVQSELDLLTRAIKQAARDLDIPPADPIYLEPLEAGLSLLDILRSSEVFRLFNGSEWTHSRGERGVLPLGAVDNPQRCEQGPFSLNFNEEGGHLWVIGIPGSGKNLTLQSLASVLALTHTPEEAQLYVLDFDRGALAGLGKLPHTGAVIRPHERERVERLFRFLQEELRQRTEHTENAGEAELFLMVNNVSELRQQYPEEAEELGRLIRAGGSVGMHVIITSNRGSELPRSLSGNITRRLVLQQTEKQDYMDVINAVVPPLTMRTEGRGYLVTEGNVTECQVAMPDPQLSAVAENLEAPAGRFDRSQSAKERLLPEIPAVLEELGRQMGAAWHGTLPAPVQAMQEELPLTAFQAACAQLDGLGHPGSGLPLGLLYETLQPALVDARGDVPFWTVLGPRQSGKSTVLLNLIYQLGRMPGPVSFDLFSFRKGPLSRLAQDPALRMTMDPQVMIERLAAFPQEIGNDPGRFHVLLIDDLGVAFTTNNTALTTALNQFNDLISLSHHENFLVVIADLVGNLKSSQTFSSSFIKTFQQSQTGLFLSTDDADMAWFNTHINLQYRKQLQWLPGRGFLVFKGKTAYLQSPLVKAEEVGRARMGAPGV